MTVTLVEILPDERFKHQAMKEHALAQFLRMHVIAKACVVDIDECRAISHGMEEEEYLQQDEEKPGTLAGVFDKEKVVAVAKENQAETRCCQSSPAEGLEVFEDDVSKDVVSDRSYEEKGKNLAHALVARYSQYDERGECKLCETQEKVKHLGLF